MEYPHCTAENDKATEIHEDVLPGDDKSRAGVDNRNADGGECGTKWVTWFRWVLFRPPFIYPPDAYIE